MGAIVEEPTSASHAPIQPPGSANDFYKVYREPYKIVSKYIRKNNIINIPLRLQKIFFSNVRKNNVLNIPFGHILKVFYKVYREPYKNPYGREGVVGGTVGAPT